MFLLKVPTSACLPHQTLSYDEHHLIEVARSAVVAEVTHSPVKAAFLTQQPKPVFVTIEVNGVIRGCRGDLATRDRTLDEEIAHAARDAAAHDIRYSPLLRAELPKFLVTVTIVSGTEPISDVSTLCPEDGLVLTAGGRTGIVLPWEGKDPATRLRWAYRKAKVPEGSAASLSRLSAERFRG